MSNVSVNARITALLSALVDVHKGTQQVALCLLGILFSTFTVAAPYVEELVAEKHLAQDLSPMFDTSSTPSSSPSPSLSSSKVFRFAVPKLEKFPKAGTEMIRRMQEAMKVEYNVEIEPSYIPWYRLNLAVERGETEFVVKTHVLEYEKYVPDIVRVDIPIISYNEIKITNRDGKIGNNIIGVLRGSMQEKTYCGEQECMLANSVSHLMTLFRHERVKSIIALEVLVEPEMKHFETYDLEYETVFTHYGYVYMFQEYAKYKEGLERQFLQYWRKTETGYIWQKEE